MTTVPDALQEQHTAPVIPTALIDLVRLMARQAARDAIATRCTDGCASTTEGMQHG